jgi:hypothetical protein
LADTDTDTNTDSIDNSIDTSGMDAKPGSKFCMKDVSTRRSRLSSAEMFMRNKIYTTINSALWKRSRQLLERQAPGHVTTLMQDTLSDIISLQFKKYSV